MAKYTANKSVMIKNNKIVPIATEAKIEMIEKMRTELPKYIKKRQKEFVADLEKLEIAKLDGDDMIQVAGQKLDIMDLTETCFEPLIKYSGAKSMYSPDQLSIVFDYYRYCTKEINKQYMYIPNKEDLCRLLGIATYTLKDYAANGSIEMREITAKIDDWISAYITQNALQEKIEKQYSIFYQKASLGRRDNDPIQVNNYTQNNTILPDAEFRELLNKYSNDISGNKN